MASDGGPLIRAFFDEATNTISYLIVDPITRRGAVVDPVLDYDPAAAMVDTRSVEAILAAAAEMQVRVERVLETHAHADHLSAAPYIKAKTGARIGIGEHIKDVQRIFRPIFNLADLRADGGDFDDLADGERFASAISKWRFVHPRHTGDVSYKAGDAVFVGDTRSCRITERARRLSGRRRPQALRPIHRLLALPPATRLFMCHDYKATGRSNSAWESTVGEQRAMNVHLRDGIGEEDFVRMRVQRDLTLEALRLLLPPFR